MSRDPRKRKKKKITIRTRVHNSELSPKDHEYVLSYTLNFYLILHEILCNTDACTQ